MSLTPGTRIGVYEVSAQIGAGGMGEVYRARDTTLNRDVALEILPDAFASDPDRLARLTREAQTLASLNHPNIAHIHGLEESGGVRALVMELVEGEDLTQRMARGPMPIDEALPIAKQIAEALEAAHEQGIIHRDLKPANIKVRSDGTVKVLDFGLAKATEPVGRASDVSRSPTLTTPAMTQGGIILGTAAYMSPEQAAGKSVDRRADIWSFGVVLWELLTGQRLFGGETISHTLADVLRAPIDFEQLLSTTPRVIRDVAKRCLDRDVKTRLRDIGEARIAIQKYLSNPAEEAAVVVPVAPPTSSIQSRVAWAVMALVFVGLATVSFLHFRGTSVEPPRVHLSIPLTANTAVPFLALSPDGRSLVMSQGGLLAIRSLESGEVRPLTGTQGAFSPFWSPDSRTIAFFASGDRTLKTVAASGGPARTLCDDGSVFGGTWNRAGTIVFATRAGVLTRTSAAGGPCTELAKPEAGVQRAVPVFLPDGDHFLYVLATTDEGRRGLYVASLGDPNGRRLLADRSSAVFVPNEPGSNQGRLLFVREQTLMAQVFDAASLQLSGEPVKVANQVSFTAIAQQIAASADTNGTLMYVANSSPERPMVWYDRSGKELGRAVSSTGRLGVVSLAPDGKRVAFGRTDAQDLTSLWVQDLERNQETPLTKPPIAPSPPVWSPDGEHVVFRSTGAGVDAMYVKHVNSGKEEILLKGTNPTPPIPSDWSRDGRWLVYTENDPKTGADIWIVADPLNPSAGHKPVALLQTPAAESQGQISPDGKWLAYYSDESATGQIYLRPFAGGSSPQDTKWPVSTALSFQPRWRADSKELFYLEYVTGTPRFKLMAVPIGAAPNIVGTPRPLFEFRSQAIVPQLNSFLYSPAANGQRFLISLFATETQPTLEVILNWGRTPSGK